MMMDAPTLHPMHSSARLLWMLPQRVFYAGLLGKPGPRRTGALTVYVAADASMQVRLGEGEWSLPSDLVVIAPYSDHEIRCPARHVRVMLIEPESVQLDALPDWLRSCGALDLPDVVERVRCAHALLLTQARSAAHDSARFDELFLGAPLTPRRLDARIAQALQALQAPLSEEMAASGLAAAAGLSVSRFLHLFKAETGVAFRTLRRWKRARSLLHHVGRADGLLDVALDMGYPDATHFSHAIRQTYGLPPREIFAGSRKLKRVDGA